MSVKNELRVLVVDDTIFYRKIISDIIGEVPGVEVVGTANNGKIALARIATLKPDLVTLDIDMPEINGLELLKRIKKDCPDTAVIMISAVDQHYSRVTIRALEMGAFDFISKPESSDLKTSKEMIQNNLIPILNTLIRRKEVRISLRSPEKQIKETASPLAPASALVVERMKRIVSVTRAKSQVVAIGISTGGPKSLARVIPLLPGDLNVPVLIVQHMPPVFTQALAKSLDEKSKLSVVEAADGELIRPNVVYIAPGGKQMKVDETSDNKKIIRITDDPPENSCKPSADYLFRSVARHYPNKATGVIMTGMGTDGNIGLKIMKNKGAFIIAQNEDTCIVYGMPKEPVESGTADTVLPLERIAEAIAQSV